MALRPPPLLLNRFVGRVSELARLERELAGGARLVTVWGPAGMGKTRLALRFGEEARRAGWGVGVCELEDCRSAAELCSAIAAALEVALPASADTTRAATQLGRALAARGRLLVILDNLEQATAAAEMLLSEWTTLPGEVTYLATSRERLQVPGVVTCELEPLSLTRAGEAIASSEAVQLFVDRARELRADIPVEGRSGERVAALVEQLEGIPLAIELAAARIDILGVDDLIARLGRRLDLLSAADRADRGRQATLRGAIAWSWDLLSEVERSTLGQASVFRGGFTLSAAEQVIECDEEVLDVLQRLSNKSLLRTSQAGDTARFLHYESVRAFATEAASEDTLTAARTRHRDYYLTNASSWCTAIERDGSPASLAALGGELNNLLRVHSLALVEGDARSAAEAALALDYVYATWGPLQSSIELLGRTLELDGVESSERALLRARGNAHRVRGKTEAAQRDLERAAEGATGALQAAVLADLGVLHHQRRELDQADEYYRRALRGARAADATRIEARVLGNVGALAHDQCSYDEAEEGYRRALALFSDIGDRRHEGIFLANLAVLERELDRAGDARTHYRRALALLEETGDRRLVGITLGNLAAHEHAAGNLEEARGCYQRSLGELQAMGELRSEALCRGRLGAVLASLDDIDAARAHIDVGERLLERVDDQTSLAAVRIARAFIDITESSRARIAGKAVRADELLALVRRRMEEAASGSPSLIEQSDDARALIRILRGTLGQLDADASTTPDALLVGPEARWFRPPHGEALDLTRRRALRLILLFLTELRRLSPGQGASVAELQEAGWPGEKMKANAGANRVYVTLNKLRKLGLQRILIRGEDGYLLDPSVALERVASDWRALRS